MRLECGAGQERRAPKFVSSTLSCWREILHRLNLGTLSSRSRRAAVAAAVVITEQGRPTTIFFPCLEITLEKCNLQAEKTISKFS